MAKRKNSRNANGSGTLRKRADGRWEGIFTLGRDPLTGKLIKKSVYAKTQAECRRKLTEKLNALDTKTYIEPSKMTVAQWMDTWLELHTSDVKTRTRTMYAGFIHNRINPCIGHIALRDLNRETITRFYKALADGYDDRKPLSPKTIKNIHGILHRALDEAVISDLIVKNPTSRVALPRCEKKEIRPMDDAQMRAFLAAIKGHRYEAIYLTALFTGMRQGELLGLSWDNVDLRSGVIRIVQQLQIVEHEYKIVSVKSDRARTIMPAPFVLELLRKQMIQQKKWQLAAGGMWSNSQRLVFTNEIGQHYARQTVYSNFKRIVASLGMPEARFHDMRHSFAVSSLRAGDDVKTVQNNLGHYSAAFTLDQYAFVLDEMKRDSAARMQQFIDTLASS